MKKKMQVNSPEYRALVSGLLGKEVQFEDVHKIELRKSPKIKTEKLSALNRDVIEIILSSATASDVTNLCQTDKNFQRVCKDPNVFKRLMDKFYPGISQTNNPKNQFYLLTETAAKYDRFNPAIRKSGDTYASIYVTLNVEETKRRVEGYIRIDFMDNKVMSNVSTTAWSDTSPKTAKNLGHAYIALGEIMEILLSTFPEVPDNLKKYIPR
jgi:hypothetical protein